MYIQCHVNNLVFLFFTLSIGSPYNHEIDDKSKYLDLFLNFAYRLGIKQILEI